MSVSFATAFAGKTVLVTGHTGFKGSWLALWLGALGARVVGLSLDPPTAPSHHMACGMGARMIDLRGDVRDYSAIADIMQAHRPELVFHLAAQPLIRRAYADPRETFEINVMGTVNVLEAARRCAGVRVVVVATSDKAYRNTDWHWPYRETDPLGGHEPYGASKACADIVTEVYRQARFQTHAHAARPMAVASARAGNVIGGGDWAMDRLVPDIVRAIAARRDVVIRNPEATRPWQHVLDCLSGYLLLAARLLTEPGSHEDAWNIGPDEPGAVTAAAMVSSILAQWPGHGTRLVIDRDPPGKESPSLRVDSSKAIHRLGWRPCWTTATAIAATIAWYHRFSADDDMHPVSLDQIAAYTGAAREARLCWATP